jgi:phosphoglycolate phosphatase
MQHFGVTQPETLYIGDADVDIETGHAAEVRSVGVTRGNFTREQLEDLGAWRVIDSLEGLLSIVTTDGSDGNSPL